MENIFSLHCCFPTTKRHDLFPPTFVTSIVFLESFLLCQYASGLGFLSKVIAVYQAGEYSFYVNFLFCVRAWKVAGVLKIPSVIAQIKLFFFITIARFLS